MYYTLENNHIKVKGDLALWVLNSNAQVQIITTTASQFMRMKGYKPSTQEAFEDAYHDAIITATKLAAL